MKNKEFIILKARQTGKSNHLKSFLSLYNKKERSLLRKETIKRLFNI